MTSPDRFKVAKDILDRNRLLGTGTPEDPRGVTFAPQQHNTFDVRATKFDELSDNGLNIVEQLLKGLLANRLQPVLEVSTT